jgi:hypothetical protein
MAARRRCFLRRPPCRPDGDVGSGGVATPAPPRVASSAPSPPSSSCLLLRERRHGGPAARSTHHSGPQLLPRLQRLLPLFSSLWIAAQQKDLHGRRRRSTGRRIGAALKGRLLGFGWREWAAGIPFRGTRRPSGAPAQQGRGGCHGWRRPWGRRGSPCLASRWGRKGCRERIRSDRWGPLVSETRREMKGSGPAGLCWAARHGGLAGCVAREEIGVL